MRPLPDPLPLPPGDAPLPPEPGPEHLDTPKSQLLEEGLSLDAYLNVLLGLLNEGTALAEISEAEFEAFIEDSSKGSEHFPPLPPDFCRVDIYADHD